MGRLSAGDEDVPFVQFESHRARDGPLCRSDKGVQGLANRGEPLAVVNEIGILQRELVLHAQHFLVEADGFEFAVRLNQQRAARRFIGAARFHANQPILHQIDASDAVLAANPVEGLQQFYRRQTLSVDADRSSLVELNLDVAWLVGSLLGETVSFHIDSSASLAGFSRMPPSWLMCQMLRSSL